MTSLLPHNATGFERAVESALASVDELPIPIDLLWNPSSCPASLLPWLAWSLSVDIWDSQWSEQVKRTTISNSVLVHKTKGTRAAIRRSLSSLNVVAELEEWFQYDGPPHTFRLTAWSSDQVTAEDNSLLSAALYRNLLRLIHDVKPARSHFDFRVGARFISEIGMGSIALPIVYQRQTVLPEVQARLSAVLSVPAQITVIPFIRTETILVRT